MSPSQLRGAPTVTEYLYDDEGRIARTVTAAEWTDDDRALMLARQMHLASLCECEQPRDVAWHPAMEGWYEVAVFSCNACAARTKVKNDSHQRVVLRNGYDEQANGPLGSLPTMTFVDPEDLAMPTMNTEGGAAE